MLLPSPTVRAAAVTVIVELLGAVSGTLSQAAAATTRTRSRSRLIISLPVRVRRAVHGHLIAAALDVEHAGRRSGVSRVGLRLRRLPGLSRRGERIDRDHA